MWYRIRQLYFLKKKVTFENCLTNFTTSQPTSITRRCDGLLNIYNTVTVQQLFIVYDTTDDGDGYEIVYSLFYFPFKRQLYNIFWRQIKTAAAHSLYDL